MKKLIGKLKIINIRYSWKNILGIITGEPFKCYFNKTSETEKSKAMVKYAQIKRFNYDHQLQFYIYSFVYINPDTMPDEE